MHVKAVHYPLMLIILTYTYSLVTIPWAYVIAISHRKLSNKFLILISKWVLANHLEVIKVTPFGDSI
jgi:hypothetical protein